MLKKPKRSPKPTRKKLQRDLEDVKELLTAEGEARRRLNAQLAESAEKLKAAESRRQFFEDECNRIRRASAQQVWVELLHPDGTIWRSGIPEHCSVETIAPEFEATWRTDRVTLEQPERQVTVKFLDDPELYVLHSRDYRHTGEGNMITLRKPTYVHTETVA